ncbi:MAG TPA: phospholipase D-like domain-containing protein [Ktedonobacteraceae bacterium]|jgi:cardiolipin synthase|nr:phospholipase D-like domain-containing protein [Ktedonobacteraceae bacterium]
MTAFKDHIQSWIALLFKPRAVVIRVLKRVLAGFFIADSLIVTILMLVSAIRRRNNHAQPFPRIPLQEVRVGENTLQLYSYGRDLFDAMLSAITNATESIYLESYIWKDDEVGQQFRDLLGQKAAEGVEVYVIYDKFGNLVVPGEFYKAFSPSIHRLEYLSVSRPWHVFDPRRYSLDHRKLLIVDGSISFIGGYNIGSAYAYEWRDTHLRINGPASANLAHSFIDFWNRFSREKNIIEQRYSRRFDPLITVHGNDALHLTFPIRELYISAIERAERYILLTNAYFVPDHILLESLKAAARRGVEVHILVPWMSNHIVTDWVSHCYFSECLEAGIRIFGYRHTMLHAKTCTIDGEWSTVGTANLDRLSSIGNYEVNVEIYSTAFAEQMEALFRCDTSDIFELTLKGWESRQWYIKVSERLLKPLRFIM